MSREVEHPRALMAMIMPLGVCILAIVALGLGKVTGAIDPLFARRGVGAVIGLVLAVTGNFVPKLRLFQPAIEPGLSEPMDRFAGWIFLACGLAFAAVFLLAPAAQLFIVPPLIVVGGLLAVLIRWLAWQGRQRGRATPDLTMARFALAMMLVTVFWTCVIFVADAIWDDAVSQWVALLFVLVLIPLAAVLYRAAEKRR